MLSVFRADLTLIILFSENVEFFILFYFEILFQKFVLFSWRKLKNLIEIFRNIYISIVKMESLKINYLTNSVSSQVTKVKCYLLVAQQNMHNKI
jgi:hypothetical protein